MSVSPSKARVVASCSVVAQRVAGKCRHINLQVARTMEALGIGHGAGRSSRCVPIKKLSATRPVTARMQQGRSYGRWRGKAARS